MEKCGEIWRYMVRGRNEIDEEICAEMETYGNIWRERERDGEI